MKFALNLYITRGALCVICFISLSYPEAVDWDEDAVFVRAGVDEGDVQALSGETFLLI